MKNILFVAIAFLFTTTSFAQGNVEQSDPAAKVILEKLRKKYEAYQTVEADFKLTIEIPEEDQEIQTGNLAQEGEKYRLKLDNQAIYSDGKTLWLYLKSNNEVQVNNVEDFEDEEEDFLSPKDLLRIYEKEDFIYALMNDSYENGKAIQQIEFKPLDEDSEYAKMRLTIDKKKTEIIRIKAFAVDGARYTMDVTKFKPNQSYKNADFVFNPADYPGIHVEDLRID
ncbi:MAG: outer membrane lipoprotein carrier protein LolA [Bacteroidota bacterium]